MPTLTLSAAEPVVADSARTSPTRTPVVALRCWNIDFLLLSQALGLLDRARIDALRLDVVEQSIVRQSTSKVRALRSFSGVDDGDDGAAAVRALMHRVDRHEHRGVADRRRSDAAD